MYQDLNQGLLVQSSILYFFSHTKLYFTLFYFTFYCYVITVVPISPPLLSPALSTLTSHIQSSSPPCPLSLSMGPLYKFLDDSSSSLSCYPALPFPCSCCQFVPYFHALVLLCSLVLLIRFHL